MPQVFTHDVEKGSSDFKIRQDDLFERELPLPTYYVSSFANDKSADGPPSIRSSDRSSSEGVTSNVPF